MQPLKPQCYVDDTSMLSVCDTVKHGICITHNLLIQLREIIALYFENCMNIQIHFMAKIQNFVFLSRLFV